jgi:hypothetical protein
MRCAVPLEMWFRDDLKNILFSINVASAAAARFSDEALVAAYRQGFEEALESAAVALGIAPGEVGLRTGRDARSGENSRGLRISR